MSNISIDDDDDSQHLEFNNKNNKVKLFCFKINNKKNVVFTFEYKLLNRKHTLV